MFYSSLGSSEYLRSMILLWAASDRDRWISNLTSRPVLFLLLLIFYFIFDDVVGGWALTESSGGNPHVNLMTRRETDSFDWDRVDGSTPWVAIG
jgi:hypothetical protein